MYFGIQLPIFLRYFISTFLNLKHIQNITTVKQIFQICLHDIYLLALVFQRASVRNWPHLYLQVVVKILFSFIQKKNLKGVSFILGKSPHDALICFHYTLFFIRTSKFCLRLAVLNFFFHFWGWNVLNLFLFSLLNLAMPQRRMSDWLQ